MKTHAIIGLATMVLLCGSALAADDHIVVTPNDIKWNPAPASVPKGAQIAVLYGDPTKEGPFALRLKLPAGYHIPPHTHPKPEVVTVVSGVLLLGQGSEADKSKAKTLPAGSFSAMTPGMQHYVYAGDQETVVQLNTIGPWALNYVNEKDDPRKTQ